MTTAQKTFIERVGKMARDDMARSGILASLTIAQAILESRWGTSGLTRNGNALFGIKAGTGWKGPTLNCKTFEFYGGQRVDIKDNFRAYGSWEESVADHGKFLQGLARYKAVVGERDYKKACKAIHAAGYATAPAYADALINLIEQYGLAKWDGTQPPAPDKTVSEPEAAYTTYTIKGGADTLWALASRFLGDGTRWPEIAAANGGLDPKKVRIGQIIRNTKK
jgi:flagellum-specific peptidoglycan hydrolase FlgJ